MDALHLHVEHGLRVDDQPHTTLHLSRQPHFVGGLDFSVLGTEGRVVDGPTQTFHLFEVVLPTMAEMPRQQGRQTWVGLHQPTPHRNTVGDVGETLGVKPRKFREEVRTDQVTMQRRHAIHMTTGDDRHVGHTHAAAMVFVDDGQAAA